MIQIKIINSENLEKLNDSINSFLAGISNDSVRDISVDLNSLIGIIQYDIKEEWLSQMCCDCQHWDDSGQSSSVVGLCQICGGRKRFNSKACSEFVDVRI